MIVWNVLAVLWPAAIYLAYTMLIGFGVQAALLNMVRFPPGLGIIAGIGTAVAVVPMSLCYRLLHNTMLPILPLAVLAVIAIAARLVVVERARAGDGLKVSGLRQWLSPADAFGALAALFLLVPVVGFGLTFWTIRIADFPNYAASAEIWMHSAAAFVQHHPDLVGLQQTSRASFEKPMVTAALIILTRLSGAAPYELLTPLLLVFLFMFLSAVVAIGARFLNGRYVPASVATLIPALSSVPVSRVYAAQPGQVAAVALVACFLHVLAHSDATRRRGGIATSAVGGIVLSAALGSNFTLLVGSGVGLAALVAWLLSRDATRILALAWRAAGSLLVAAVLTAPLLPMLLLSLGKQTNGEPGGDIPLASPLSLIGQQAVFDSTAPLSEQLIAWSVLALVLFAVIGVSFRHRRWKASFDILLVVAIAVNALIIGLKLGWVNYAEHKFTAVVIWLVMPPVLAYALSALSGRVFRAAAGVGTALLVSAAAITLIAGQSVTLIGTPDLMALRNSPVLAALPKLNLTIMPSTAQTSFASLILPSREVNLVGSPWPAGPMAADFLVHRARIQDRYTNIRPLNASYALATIDLTAPASTIDFTAKTPGSARYLFGSTWYAADERGTWSGLGNNYFVFDVAPSMRGHDVEVNIVGGAFAADAARQTIRLSVAGKVYARRTYPSTLSNRLRVVIPKAVVQALEGRIPIQFWSSGPVAPSITGTRDTRPLAFRLVSVTVKPR